MYSSPQLSNVQFLFLISFIIICYLFALMFQPEFFLLFACQIVFHFFLLTRLKVQVRSQIDLYSLLKLIFFHLVPHLLIFTQVINNDFFGYLRSYHSCRNSFFFNFSLFYFSLIKCKLVRRVEFSCLSFAFYCPASQCGTFCCDFFFLFAGFVFFPHIIVYSVAFELCCLYIKYIQVYLA